MSVWESVLKKLVKFGDRLPEHLREGDGVDPPTGRPWSSVLPACPVLERFYTLCDGGPIGRFHLDHQDELDDLRAWSGDDQYEEGHYLIFGETEYGHPLVWDSREDRVGYLDDDGANGLVMSDETGGEMMGLKIDDFLNFLFTRPRSTLDEGDRYWAETLDVLERFD